MGRISLFRSALLALGLLGAISPVAAEVHVLPVNPAATYLRTNEFGAQTIVPIDLAELGLEPGDPVILARLGQYNPGGGFGNLGSMIGVFSATATLGDPGDAHRVPDAIDAGTDVVTPATLNGGLATDIPEDFAIAPPGAVLLTIPAGARYLFVSPSDTFYRDNESFGYSIAIIPDTDGDGVFDHADQCINSDLRPLVDTGSGPTSITNTLDATGCTLQDYVNAYQAGAKNHGQYVSAIVAFAKRLEAAGAITHAQRQEMVTGAAQSDIGKKE